MTEMSQRKKNSTRLLSAFIDVTYDGSCVMDAFVRGMHSLNKKTIGLQRSSLNLHVDVGRKLSTVGGSYVLCKLPSRVW